MTHANFTPVPTATTSTNRHPNALYLPELGIQERAILATLLECRGRVVGRVELARRAGLIGSNARRCDSLLVTIRRVIGSTSVRTVRGRGWMLEASAETLARSIVFQEALAAADRAD